LIDIELSSTLIALSRRFIGLSLTAIYFVFGFFPIESINMTIEQTIMDQAHNTERIVTRRSALNSFNFPHANLKNYLQQNLNLVEGDRNLEEDETSTSTFAPTSESDGSSTNSVYKPQVEGYFSMGFSIHVPCDHSFSDCRLEIDEFSEGRLESLSMLFLCSQGVEMVISTSPGSLVYVCPFKNKDDGMPTVALERTAVTALLDNLGNPDRDPLILWNMPKFESTTIAFDDPKAVTENVIDMATNTTLVYSTMPQQYYTNVKFTYPVYQWGDEDPEVALALQEEFDASVISTGMLDTLLPWPDAIAAPTGDEPYIFWDEPLPPTGFYDTTIPEVPVRVLRGIGIAIIVINTASCIILSIMARRHRLHKEEKARRKTYDDFRNNSAPDNLDTEAGVSAILLESKHYALSKSEAYVSSRGSTATSHNDGGARNIMGVEVDLRMVDHAGQLQHHYDPTGSPEARKEAALLQRAKYRSQQTNVSPTTQLKSLLSRKDEEDDLDDVDLQILDVGTVVSGTMHSGTINSVSSSSARRRSGGENK